MEYFVNIFKKNGQQSVKIEDTLLFGSTEECDVVFKENENAQHDEFFKIFLDKDTILIEPLNTKYTIELNGDNITKKRVLHPNDEIVFNAKAKNVKKFKIVGKRKEDDEPQEIPFRKRKKLDKDSKMSPDHHFQAALKEKDILILNLEKKIRDMETTKESSIDFIKKERNAFSKKFEDAHENWMKTQSELKNTETEFKNVMEERDRAKKAEEKVFQDLTSLQAENESLREINRLFEVEMVNLKTNHSENMKILAEISTKLKNSSRVPETTQEEDLKTKQLEYQSQMDHLRAEMCQMPDQIKQSIELFLDKLIERQKKKCLQLDGKLTEISKSIQEEIVSGQLNPRLTQYKPPGAVMPSMDESQFQDDDF